MAKARKWQVLVGGIEREITIEPTDDGLFRVILDGAERLVDARRFEGDSWSLLIDGHSYVVDLGLEKDGSLLAEVGGHAARIKLSDPRLAQQAAVRSRGTGAEEVRAAMPGKVIKLLTKVGDAVMLGQGLLVIEAMKMENELRAPRAGSVKTVHVGEGQSVEPQQVLVTLA